MVIDSVAVAVSAGELLSCAATEKLEVPTAVGVPEMRPVLDKLRPGGKLPEATFHVYPGVPPVALKLPLYPAATRPDASVVEDTLNVLPPTWIEKDAL